jgi:hypothetical protein
MYFGDYHRATRGPSVPAYTTHGIGSLARAMCGTSITSLIFVYATRGLGLTLCLAPR